MHNIFITDLILRWCFYIDEQLIFEAKIFNFLQNLSLDIFSSVTYKELYYIQRTRVILQRTHYHHHELLVSIALNYVNHKIGQFK